MAVNSDRSVKKLKGDGRPLNPLDQRLAVLSALQSVDWVTSFDSDTPLALIEQIVPDILVKGGDYAVDDIVGADAVRQAGGDVHVVPYIEGFSSSGLIKRLENPESSSA